jgi:putative transposase
MAEIYIKEVGTRKVLDIFEILCGATVSSAQVSRVSKELDEEITAWKSEGIGQIQYLVPDTTYQVVRIRNKATIAALLRGFGVDYEGHGHILDAEVAFNEAGINWCRFLEGLVKRGLHGLRMISSDDHSGVCAAIEAVFSGILWQRCQFHLQKIARSYVSRKEDIPEVHFENRRVFKAPDLENAHQYLQRLIEK